MHNAIGFVYDKDGKSMHTGHEIYVRMQDHMGIAVLAEVTLDAAMSTDEFIRNGAELMRKRVHKRRDAGGSLNVFTGLGFTFMTPPDVVRGEPFGTAKFNAPFKPVL